MEFDPSSTHATQSRIPYPMKTNDPLDQKIDALFRSRPLQPSEDFAARVLDAAHNADTVDTAGAARRSTRGKLLAFALPLAAAIVVTLSLLQFNPGAQDLPVESTTITQADAQEIFLLEEGLSGLSLLEGGNFQGGDLLATLDALTLEI
jgi:hypothetical protein